jgi:hypothetical protein
VSFYSSSMMPQSEVKFLLPCDFQELVRVVFDEKKVRWWIGCGVYLKKPVCSIQDPGEALAAYFLKKRQSLDTRLQNPTL